MSIFTLYANRVIAQKCVDELTHALHIAVCDPSIESVRIQLLRVGLFDAISHLNTCAESFNAKKEKITNMIRNEYNATDDEITRAFGSAFSALSALSEKNVCRIAQFVHFPEIKEYPDESWDNLCSKGCRALCGVCNRCRCSCKCLKSYDILAQRIAME